MANLFIDLDTGGAAADVSAQGKTKTFNVAGSFSGWLTIEANCGGEWREVLRFQAPGNKTLDGAFKELRANVAGVSGTVDRITVSADDTGAKFEELPVNGAAVDVSALGTFNTVVIGGDPLNGLLKILISDDGVDWTDWKAYQSATVDSDEVVTQFMKATYDGSGTPEVCIGAVNETDSTATPVSNYVYRPGATGDDAPGGNVYTDWEECYAALQSTKDLGSRTLEFDGRYSGEVGPGNGKVARIPEGSWDMEGVQWMTVPRDGSVDAGFLAVETLVAWDDNAFCPNVDRMIGNYWHDGEVHSPLSSACVMGDAGFVTRLINTNPLAAPMLKIPDNQGFFIQFLDNRVQVTTLSGDVVPAPIIDFGNNFGFVACRGGEAKENAFANSGFLLFFIWPSLSGPHNWTFPAMSGFRTNTVSPDGGLFMDTDIAVDVGDFSARVNQVRRIDSSDIDGSPDDDFQTSGGETTLTDSTASFSPSLVGRNVTVENATSPANNGTWPISAVTGTTLTYGNAGGVSEAPGAATYTIEGTITATLPQILGVGGEPITLMDVGGAAGVNPISVAGPNTIEAPYLNRPFQSKTWKSQPDGNWLLVADSFEEFVTDPILAADTAMNNATNKADPSAGSFALTFPLAADAEKGSIIRVVNIGASGNTVTPTADGGDTVVGAAAIGNADFGAWQSDGGTLWLKIA